MSLDPLLEQLTKNHIMLFVPLPQFQEAECQRAQCCGSGGTQGALFGEGESCFDEEMGEKKGEESTVSGTAHGPECGSQTQRLKQPRKPKGTPQAGSRAG